MPCRLPHPRDLAVPFALIALLTPLTASAQPPVEALGKRSQTMTSRIAASSPSLTLVWNEDENGLATLDADGRLHFWSPELGHPIRSRRVVPSRTPAPRSLEEARQRHPGILDEDSLLRAVGVSANGLRLALALDGFSTVWNLQSLEREMRWELPGETPTAITVDSDGDWVVTGDEQGRLCIGPVMDGPPADDPRPDAPGRQCTVVEPDAGPIVVLAAGPGNRLAVGYGHRVVVGAVVAGAWSGDEMTTLRVVDSSQTEGRRVELRERSLVRLSESQPFSSDNALATLAFSPSGDFLAAGWNDGSIDLLPLADDGATPDTTRDRPRLGAKVTALAFSPDGKNLLAGDAAGHLKLWSFDTDSPSFELVPNHGASSTAIRGVAFDPAGHRVASTDAEGTTFTWARSSGRQLRRLVNHGRPMVAIRWANVQELWTVSTRPSVYGWNVSADLETVWIGPERLAALGLQAPPTVAIASPDGERVALGFGEGSIALWLRRDLLAGGDPVAVWSAHEGPLTDLVFEPLGPEGALLSTDATGTVRRWSDQGNVKPWSFEGRTTPTLDAGAGLRRLVFSPDGHQLAFCSERGVELIDTVTGHSTAVARPGEAALSLHFPTTAEGEPAPGPLMVAFETGLHDWTPGQEPELFQQLGRGVRSLDFAPFTGDLASTQSSNGAVEIWSFVDGRLKPRHLLVSGEGDLWLACEDSGTCRRNDDGTLLLERETDQPFTPMLPVLETTPKLEVVESPDALTLVPGTATPFTVTVRNQGPGPAPWVTLAPRQSTSGLLFHPPETLTWLAEGDQATLEAALTLVGNPRPTLEIAVLAAHSQARDGLSTDVPPIRLRTPESPEGVDSRHGGGLTLWVGVVGAVLLLGLVAVRVARRL